MCVHTHSISCDPVVSTVRIILVYPYIDSCHDLSDHRCSFTSYNTTVLTQMEYAAATVLTLRVTLRVTLCVMNSVPLCSTLLHSAPRCSTLLHAAPRDAPRNDPDACLHRYPLLMLSNH